MVRVTRLVLAAALAAAAAVPVTANATETCYYRNATVHVCRDPEYRACLLYVGVRNVEVPVGNGCP